MFTDAGGSISGGDNNDVDFDPLLVFPRNPVVTAGSSTAGAINAGSVQAAAGTSLTMGAINANGRVALSSGGAMQTQAISTGSSLQMTSGSTINAGNLTANSLARVSAAGAVNVGNISIIHPQNQTGITTQAIGPGSPVEVFGASIATGNISTDGYVGLYTPGGLTVGTVTAGHDIIALVGTNATFGSVQTPERFLLGGYGMFAALNGGESFNPAAAFSTPKLKTGGSGTFGAASSANSFQAYVGNDLTAKAVNAQGINALAGGTATVDGAWTAPSITLASRDINITANGTINGGQTGLVTLNAVSTNGDALIGDGLTGNGYALSNAEFGRISSGNLRIIVGGNGGDADTRVGDLTRSGNNIKSGSGGLTIAT